MSRPDKECGTVLLTTLLIMAVMAAVSVAIMDDIRFAVKRTINVGDYAQADWYVRGAEDFAQSYIESQLAPMDDTLKNELFKTPQTFTFPYEGGMMILDVRDGTDCFALGSLVTSENGSADVARGRQFTNLLVALGWPDNDARKLTGVLTDWIDSDRQRGPNGAEDGDYLRRDPPHRTANIALSSVMELRSLEGMTEELYQSIRPYLCAREIGEKTALNINTAEPIDAFLLSAILGGPDYYQTALQILAERPEGGYDATTLKATPALQGFEGKEAAFDQILYAPQYLWVEVRVDYLNASRLVTYEYAVSGRETKLTYRGWGSESLRPTLEEEELELQ